MPVITSKGLAMFHGSCVPSARVKAQLPCQEWMIRVSSTARYFLDRYLVMGALLRRIIGGAGTTRGRKRCPLLDPPLSLPDIDGQRNPVGGTRGKTRGR